MYNEFDNDEEQLEQDSTRKVMNTGSNALNKIKNTSNNLRKNRNKGSDESGSSEHFNHNNLGKNSSFSNSFGAKKNTNSANSQQEGIKHKSSADKTDKPESASEKVSSTAEKSKKAGENTEKVGKAGGAAKKAGKAAKTAGKAAATGGKAAASGGASLIADAAKEKVKGLINSIKRLAEANRDGEELDPEVKRKLVRKILLWSFIIFVFFGPSIMSLTLSSHMISGIGKDLGDDFTTDDFSFVENAKEAKKEADKIFEKAYEKALSEAKKKCNKDGADWDDSEKTLESTNSSSWEDVYKDANYIDYFTMMSLVVDGLNYDKYENINQFSDEISKDKYIKHLYYIQYEKTYYDDDLNNQEIDKDTKESDVKSSTEFYYTITIHSYTEWNLTQIVDKDIYEPIDYTELSNFDIEDYVTDDGEDDNVKLGEDAESYDDHILSARLETIGLLEEIDEDGNVDDSLVKELNGYNETPKYPLVDDIQYDDVLEDYVDMDLGQFDTSEWYTDVPVEADGSGKKVKTYESWLNMYDAPTSTSSSTSFYVNTALARSDIQQDVSEKVSNMNSSSVSGNWCSIEYYYSTSDNSPRKMHGVKWEIGEGTAAVKDGRYLIACGPGIVNDFYWSETGGIGNSPSWYNYGSLKMDLVIKEKASGEVYYIPVTTGDSKAHTFPYGISQTGVRIPQRASEDIVGSDFHSDTAIKGNGNAKDYASVLDTYSTKLRAVTPYTIATWLNHGAIEWCSPGGGKAVATSRINSLCRSYELLGVIVY